MLFIFYYYNLQIYVCCNDITFIMLPWINLHTFMYTRILKPIHDSYYYYY